MSVLEPPDCELGYTEPQVDRILGPLKPAFNVWALGNTMAICNGTEYNHQLGLYEATTCGPHGLITYACDLEDFLAGRPNTD